MHSLRLKPFFCVFSLLLFSTASWAFSTGAPDAACDTMTPVHGVPPQTGKSPYRVIMQTTDVAAGESITMTLSAPTSGPPFKGFLIQVHPRNGDSPVGEFEPNFDPNAQPRNCNGKTNSAMTHKSLDPKVQIKLKWTPPGGEGGEYVPVITWVKQQDTFWVKEMPDGKVIKVTAGGSPSEASGPSREPGSAAEEAKPKQEDKNLETDKNTNSSSVDPPGNQGVSSFNSISTWTTMAVVLCSVFLIHRLF